MDTATYEAWWALHQRAARGESLSTDERATYDAGCKQLHQGETLNGGADQLRQARAEVQALEAEHSRLNARRQQLDAEINSLEARVTRIFPAQ